MNPNDPNVQMLEIVAARLGEALCEQLVFVGGAVAGLLVTDPALPAIRPTEDVDLLAQVLARADYYAIEAQLRALGFEQDLRPQAPICRWLVGGVTVDLMPTLPEILGFSNRWYPIASASAVATQLPSGRELRVISAPAFVATKLEAFAGRGGGDYLFSHDLGDVLSIVDGRASLLDELEASPPQLRDGVAEAVALLLSERRFRDSLPGHLPTDAASQARLPTLVARLESMAALRGA
jgi:predicted nucleotidyltransferase